MMATQFAGHLLPPRWRSCHTSDGRPKRRYRWRREAERDARRIEEAQCKPMHAYVCPECHTYHVGYDATRAAS